MQQISYNKYILLFTLILVNTNLLFSQSWEAPAEKKAKASPFLFTATTIKEGEAIYTKNCQSCHGDPGKDNMLKSLSPQPPDPASAKMQKNTDGEIFYKITTGKSIMPSFKNILSETERWNIVSYFRSFNKSYVQSAATAAVKASLIKLKAKFDAATNKLIITARKAAKTDSVPVKDAEIVLFVKRYFGNMQVDSTRQTNELGIAAFNFPKTIPGDSAGLLNIIVKINDDISGEAEDSFKLKIGVPTNVPGLTEKRAMWNVLSKSPIWIMVTYFSILLGVWAFLLYIITRLAKLKKIGKQ